MQLPQTKIDELKRIVVENYGVLLNDKETNELAESCLRLTRVGLNSLARRIETDKKKEVAFSANEKTRSNQQVCEIPKPAGQQGVLLRPKNVAGIQKIIPRGSVLTFRPSARGGHLVTDDIEVSSNPGVTTSSSDQTPPEENGYIVNPSHARNRVFSYIRSQALAPSISTT